MLNIQKHSIDYYTLRNRQKEIKKAIEKIVDKYPEVETGEKDKGGWNIFRSQIMLDIETLYDTRKEYSRESRDDRDDDILNYYEYLDLKTPYEEIENLLNLFIERKQIKRKIWTIKGVVMANLYSQGRKLLK